MSEDPQPALAARGLVRRFGRLTAVDDVDLVVPAGSIFGLLGPNGSGKSTIIRMCCGLLRPTAGTLQLLDTDVVRRPEQIKPRIGYMSQAFSLYRELTVAENLTFYGMAYRLGRRRALRTAAVVEQLGLASVTGQIVDTLSGGWKQRLALACALLHEPAVLFLDEPTAGIDPVARRVLWDLLFDLSAAGKTLIVTTHYMDEAERCDRLGYLFRARMLAAGTPAELRAHPAVTPADTRRVELTGGPALLQRLRRVEGVREATLFGQAIRLLVDVGLPDARLTSLAGPDAVARPVAPSLEDVFVTLTRRAESEAAA